MISIPMRSDGLKKCFAVIALVAGASFAHIAYAQETYPQKPIELIVPFAAGGGGDGTARVIARYLGEELGQTISVINKPGGNAIPGVLEVMSAGPDGYTLLYDTVATSSLQFSAKNLPYDPGNRTWGPRYSEGPYAFAVNAGASYKTLAELMGALRQSPESISVAWLGGSTLTDTTILALLAEAGVDIAKVRKVPFQGSGPGMTALAGGHIDLAGGALPSMTALAAGGTIRLLAVTGDARVPEYPDVPTAKEAGFPVPITSWSGIAGPAGISDEVVQRLDEAVKTVVANPKFIEDVKKFGNSPVYLSLGS